MTKRVLAFLMVIAMVFSLVPTVAVAVEPEATDIAAFEVIIQRSHNQTSTEGVDVDIYLQAAQEAEVTAIQLRLTQRVNEIVDYYEGLQATETEVDEEKNEIDPATFMMYASDGETSLPIAVGPGRILLATVNAASVDDVVVAYAEVTVEAGFYTTDTEATGDEGYQGAVEATTVRYSETCGHNQEGTWTEFTATSGELAAGKYYLTGDVQLTGTLDVAADAEVTVCLNGYDITAKASTRMFQLTKAGATLNICDCTATGEDENYDAGRLLPKHNHGGALRASYGANAEINFFGGIIDGSLSTKKEASAILLYGLSTLNVLGGKIEGFDAGHNQDYGPVIIRGDKDGNQATAYFANVTFVNCGSSIISGAVGDNSGDNTKAVTLENVTVMNSAGSARAVALIGNLKNVTLKGNCKFDAPVYVPDGTTLTLDLGAEADFNIVTEAELNEEQFNEWVKMAEGGSLAAGAVLYETAGRYVTYDAQTGLFAFEDAHYIADKHAVDQQGNKIAFKPWTKTDSLPNEGNWYLENDVTVSAEVILEKSRVVNLDLNGHTITSAGQRVFNIFLATLNLYDGMAEYDEDGNWVSAGTSQAKITGFATNNVGCITVNTGGTFNLYSGKFSGNSGNNGPVVYLYATESDTSDRGDFNGGVFNMYGGEITANTSTYYGPISVNDFGDVPEGKERAKINISGGKIYNNTYVEGLFRLPGDVDVTMSGGEISGNTSTGKGVFFMGGNAALNITGGEISSNTSDTEGGALYMGSGNVVTIANAKITGNSAANGGALRVVGGTLTMTNVTVTNNSATGAGGAAYINNAATVTVSGGEWSNNTASGGHGGAAYVDGSGAAAFTNVTFTGNSCTGSSKYGGVIYGTGTGSLTLTGCTLTGNSSASAGAAVHLGGSRTLKLDDTVVTGNNAVGNGAVYSTNPANIITLAGRTVIAGNKKNNGASINADLFFQNKTRTQLILVDGLTAGAHVNAKNDNATELAANVVVQLAGGAAAPTNWSCGYITFYNNTYTSGKNVAYRDTDGDGTKEFTYGHWHTDANGNEYELTAWTSATALPTTSSTATELHYYLTSNVTTSAAKEVKYGSLELCTNGFNVSGSARMYTVRNGASLNIVNCTASYDENNHLLVGSKISGFHNGGNGGTIAAVYSGNTDTTNMTTIRLSGLEFTGCYDSTERYTASYGYGGGVINSRFANSLYVDGCKFTGNYSKSTGGAINIRREGSNGWKPREITNCVFENNYAWCSGGAIYIYGSDGTNDEVTIDNCVFKNNYATTAASASGATTEGTSDGGRGGAITAYKAKLTITDCEFEGNSAKHRDGLTPSATTMGGAIYANGNLSLTNTVFEGNSAAQGGAYRREGGTLTVNGCTFKENTASTSGGALYSTGSTMTVQNSMFVENEAPTGGAIYYNNGTWTFTGNTFTGNKATETTGGAIMCDNGYMSNVSGNTFEENFAQTDGGAIYSTAGTWNNFKNNVFRMNSAGSNGGAIAMLYGLTMSDCTFEGNQASTSVAGTSGGALYVKTTATGTLAINGCTFKENKTPKGSGGAIYANGTDEKVLTITIGSSDTNDTTFIDNASKLDGWSIGGAMALYGASHVTMTDVTFDGNDSYHGGVFYTAASGAQVVATDCTFRNNTALEKGGVGFFGWGRANKFDGCTFTNNTAKYGGAFYTEGSSSTSIKFGETEACTFTENKATVNGGALSLCAAVGSTQKEAYEINITVNNSTFTGNEAPMGGAIFTNSAESTVSGTTYINTPVVTITGGKFTENVATSGGSAIALRGHSQMSLNGVEITNNNDKGSRGALYPETANATLTLAGVMTVKDNVGNAYYGYDEADLFLQNKAGIQPTVSVAGLEAGSEIGIQAEDTRYTTDRVIATDAEGKADYFFSNSDDFVTWVNNGELTLVKHVDAEGNGYATVQEAINDATDSFKLQSSTKEEISLDKNLIIDLDGKDIAKITVAAEKTLTLIDSATNNYDAVEGEFGKVTVDGVGKLKTFDMVGNKRYLVIENEDGTVSAHRVYLAINSKLLRPYTYGAGFRAIFAGDETVAKNVKFGIQLYGEDIDLATESKVKASFEGMVPGLLKDEYGVAYSPNQKTVAIKNAITAEDQSNWEDILCGQPFMEMNGVTYEGAEIKLQMRDMAEAALEKVPSDSQTYEYIMKMIEKFELECKLPA